jgi:hypothetical protein
MGISWELEFFDNRQAPERRAYWPISLPILLTSLRHVNWQGADFRRDAFNLTLLASC